MSVPLQYASEADLEEDLVRRPEALLSDPPRWIARQLHTSAKGVIDLLGIAQDGRLEIYELKVNRTGRQTMAQIIDYASWLDNEQLSELAARIVTASNKNGIPLFEGFDAFEERRLRPARLVIVAGEANAALQRMVEYVRQLGLEIAVETVRHEVLPLPNLDILAHEHGVGRQWQAAREALDECFDGRGYRLQHRRRGLNYCLPNQSGTFRAFAGVYVNARRSKRELGDIFLAVHDSCIELSGREFERLRNTLEDIGLTPDRGRVRMKFYADSDDDLEPALRELAGYLDGVLEEYRPRQLADD
ncbi:MAG: endonuclease NucS [Chloroflexota bacterium]|nr:endonuclease NucS [Chloroflexota bacterium]